MNYASSLELFRFDESGLGLGWDMSVPNWFGVKSIIKLKTKRATGDYKNWKLSPKKMN